MGSSVQSVDCKILQLKASPNVSLMRVYIMVGKVSLSLYGGVPDLWSKL